MFAALPTLTARVPDLIYVVAGDEPGRPAVEQAARDAGVAEQVRFVGYVAETEKADHYRLADAFILASSGEGLGIVLLKAQACGIPAIASVLDGGAEAVAGMGEGFGFVFTEAMTCGIPVVASNCDGGIDAVRGESLGRAVDPLDDEALFESIIAALNTPHVPEDLD